MAEQIEKSFQKQPLFHNAKFATSSKKVSGKDRRWYKDVGLGFKVRGARSGLRRSVELAADH